MQCGLLQYIERGNREMDGGMLSQEEINNLLSGGGADSPVEDNSAQDPVDEEPSTDEATAKEPATDETAAEEPFFPFFHFRCSSLSITQFYHCFLEIETIFLKKWRLYFVP